MTTVTVNHIFMSQYNGSFLYLYKKHVSFFGVSDYHYVTREVMQTAIDNGDFIENAEFSGNMYGTSKAAVQAVQAKNLICILDIDMQGVRNIKRTDLNPIYISIQPPSMAVLVSTEGNAFHSIDRGSYFPDRGEGSFDVTFSLFLYHSYLRPVLRSKFNISSISFRYLASLILTSAITLSSHTTVVINYYIYIYCISSPFTI